MFTYPLINFCMEPEVDEQLRPKILNAERRIKNKQSFVAVCGAIFNEVFGAFCQFGMPQMHMLGLVMRCRGLVIEIE